MSAPLSGVLPASGSLRYGVGTLLPPSYVALESLSQSLSAIGGHSARDLFIDHCLGREHIWLLPSDQSGLGGAVSPGTSSGDKGRCVPHTGSQ